MIKVSELFYSLQGEGLFLGTPSVFLRTFGCNFTCSGFGMPRGKRSTERFDVKPGEYKEYNRLPLVHTGCDSYASWDPRFKHLSPLLTIPAIVDRMQELLPGGKFGYKHLIITGGEPLLGWQRQYVPLLKEIANRDMDLGHITFETNGTQFLDKTLKMTLANQVNEYMSVTFSISSKLPSSGEAFEDAIKPLVITDYNDVDMRTSYFKWVVSNPEDWEDVQRAIDAYQSAGVYLPVYLMPAGGTDKGYEQNKKWVAELAMKHGLRYSPRLQVDLWKNGWAT